MFCIFSAYFQHINLHFLHILHILYTLFCIFAAYFQRMFCMFCTFIIYYGTYSAYLFAYPLHILYILFCIFCIFNIFCASLCLFPSLLGSPAEGPKLTYHHRHPSLLSFILLQEAPEKSADSLRISCGIVPVMLTGTKGSRSSMEDTGITYNTCDDSRR